MRKCRHCRRNSTSSIGAGRLSIRMSPVNSWRSWSWSSRRPSTRSCFAEVGPAEAEASCGTPASVYRLHAGLASHRHGFFGQRRQLGQNGQQETRWALSVVVDGDRARRLVRLVAVAGRTGLGHADGVSLRRLAKDERQRVAGPEDVGDGGDFNQVLARLVGLDRFEPRVRMVRPNQKPLPNKLGSGLHFTL